MKKFNLLFRINLLILTFSLFNNIKIKAECELTSVTLRTQKEVDRFSRTYGNCANFGGIIIEGNSITNLNGLRQIRRSNWFYIRYCPNLTSLAGLELLERVESFALYNCSRITNVNPLSNMDVYGTITIQENLALTSLSGLNRPVNLSGNLVIMLNPNLTILGLSNLNSISLITNISHNQRLNNIQSLYNVTLMNGDVYIANNNSLGHLQAFNPNLIINGNLSIMNNPVLGACAATAICNHVRAGRATISGNTGNCIDLNRVRAICGPGLRSIEAANLEKIYPNPATNIVQIENTILTNYKLYNSFGALVWSDQFEGHKQISVSNYPKGVYLLYSSNGDGDKSEKIIFE